MSEEKIPVWSKRTGEIGYVLTDGNAIHQAYLEGRYLGRFISAETAREEIIKRYNKDVEDRNYRANFGPP